MSIFLTRESKISAAVFLLLTGIAVLTPLIIHSTRESLTELQSSKSDKKHTQTDFAVLHEFSTIEFKDQTIQWQLFHEHRQESKSVADIKDVLGPGLCIGDVDGDYLDDAIFVTGSGTTRTYGRKSWWLKHKNVTVYLNRGDHFEIQTLDIDLSPSVATMGCLLADLNLDGLNDLVISSFEGSFLFKNMGKSFQAVPGFNKIAQRKWSTGITLTDANNDGKPDLYINHYLRYKKNQNTLELGSGFNNGAAARFDPMLYDGQTNQLLINLGHFEFEDQSAHYFDVAEQDRSLSALYQDLNSDGLEDLLVLNDAGNHARLYLKQASGKFIESDDLRSPFRLMATSYAATSRSGNILISRPSGLGLSYFEEEEEEKQTDNKGVKTPRYLDTAWPLSINKTERLTNSYWGSVIADFNLDGREDLAVTTGLRTSDNYAHKRSVQQQDLLLTHNGKQFVTGGLASTERLTAGRSVGAGDFNMDGKIDLLIANNNAAAKLMINNSNTPQPWIALKSISPISTQLKISQANWHSTLHIKTTPLFLGSQSSFQVIPLASEDNLEITVNGKQHTLKPRTHYVYNNQDFVEVRKPNVAAEKPEETFSITKARIASSLHQPGGKLKHSDVQLIHKAVKDKPELAAFILQLPEKIELLHLYLEWIGDSELSDKAWSSIKALESDTSVEYLIAQFARSETKTFCAMSEVFSFWFDEEEAAIKTKYLAVPYFIRALQDTDPVRVACAANALGASEHLTASHSLIQVYPSLQNHNAKIAVIRAAGLIRQRNIESDLLDIFKSEDNPGIKVEAAISLNRLNPGLGDKLIMDYAAQINGGLQLVLLAELERPRNNVHFKPATKRVVVDSVKLPKAQVLQELQALPAEHQLLVAQRLDLFLPPRQLFSALTALPDSPEGGRRILNRQFEKLTELTEDDAILFFSSPAWKTLPAEFKSRALSAIGNQKFSKLLSIEGMEENALSSLTQSSPEKTALVFEFLKERPSKQSLALCPAFQAPQTLPEFSEEETQAIDAIYLALQAATLSKYRQTPARDKMVTWLSQQNTENTGLFFECLSLMELEENQLNSLAVWLLTLPEETETYKQKWLLSRWARGDKSSIIQSGINNRLKQQNISFAERLLSTIAPNNIIPDWLALMGQYQENSTIYQFSQVLGPVNTLHNFDASKGIKGKP